MKCLKCNGKMRVTDSREKAHNVIRRRYECNKCKARITTVESIYINLSIDFIANKIKQISQHHIEEMDIEIKQKIKNILKQVNLQK